MPDVHRLKGEWRDYYEFDVDRRHRMFYRVDESERIVYVDFLGNHPKWDKRQRWR